MIYSWIQIYFIQLYKYMDDVNDQSGLVCIESGTKLIWLWFDPQII